MTGTHTPKRGNPPPGYCTATQARRRLGNISDGMFRTLIESERITRLVPGGRSQGFYLIDDVNRVAKKMNNLPAKEERTNTYFSAVKPEDMPAVVDLLIRVFGGTNTTEKRLKWLDRNLECAFMVKSQDEVVGCVFVIPLSPEKIDVILTKSTPGSTNTVTENDILPYVPGQPAHLYIMSMCSLPGVTPSAKRIRGELLIRGLFNFFVELGKRGIDIRLIAARSSSQKEKLDGANLLRHAGFTELESTTDMRNFVVEVPRSGLPFAMNYKRAFAEWK